MTQSIFLRWTYCCLSLVIGMTLIGSVDAARIASIDIYLDGKLVASTAPTDIDQDFAVLWQDLLLSRLSLQRDFQVPEADDLNNRVVLSGKIELRLVYGYSDVVATAATDRLELVLKASKPGVWPCWYVAPVEVDRSMQLANLVSANVPTRASRFRSWLSPTVLTSAALLIGVGFLILTIVSRLRIESPRG